MTSSPLGLAQLLADYRQQIVARFAAEVQRKDLSPPGTSHSFLVDHIPAFLDEIVAELRGGAEVRMSQDATDTSEIARRHGEQRWTLGYDLSALTREYGILRHSILSLAKEAGAHLTLDEHDLLGKCLSVGVSQATAEYIAYRDEELGQQKARLEFLAEAGRILSSSLDYRSTLAKLTGLLVPRVADWCAVHLEGATGEEIPLAHVDPANVAILREIYTRYPPRRDSALGHARVASTGEPQLVARVTPDLLESWAQSPDHLGLLRALGTCSWMIVPLRVQGHVFGALTLANSESRRRYEEHDLVLAGEIARMAAVAIDNARLYELSQNERSRVEAATRAKDEFVAMVSHELRTPLNAILGWLHLMRGGSLSPAKQAHALEVIERNAQAQGQLVADLLDISRIITGKLRINPSQLDLSNVTEIAVEGLRPAADAKRVQIEVEIDRGGGDTVMRGDADRLQQVAWNLLANAVKFTPKSGGVRVRLRRVESDLELTVEDNGIGIAPEFLPHVFESFRQSDGSASRLHGGLGIGLSITKHIVELHGGAIEVESQGAGRGSLFRVRLPVSPLVSTTPGVSRVPAAQPRGAVASPAALHGVRALLVDDEADARDLVTYLFEQAGIEVRAAASAAEALRELPSFDPHVLVSDIGLPNEDGYSLIRSVRTLSTEHKSVPAIALTAFASNEDRKRALVEGFNVHMAKPVEPAALLNAIAQLVGQASARPS